MEWMARAWLYTADIARVVAQLIQVDWKQFCPHLNSKNWPWSRMGVNGGSGRDDDAIVYGLFSGGRFDYGIRLIFGIRGFLLRELGIGDFRWNLLFCIMICVINCSKLNMEILGSFEAFSWRALISCFFFLSVILRSTFANRVRVGKSFLRSTIWLLNKDGFMACAEGFIP